VRILIVVEFFNIIVRLCGMIFCLVLSGTKIVESFITQWHCLFSFTRRTKVIPTFYYCNYRIITTREEKKI